MIEHVRGRTTSVIDSRRTPRGAQVSCAQTVSRATVEMPAGRPRSTPVPSRTARASGPSDDADAQRELERALTLALQQAAAGYVSHRRWEARVRAALAALLDLFEEEPHVARLCVIEADHADPSSLALRDQTLAMFARRIDDGRSRAPRQPPPHAAQAVLAGAIGAIRAQLIQPGPAAMRDLLDPLTSFIVLPYRGAAASRRADR
jgi:hypothetical protein